MPTFEYQAQKGDGQVVRGTLFGTSLDVAIRDLAAQGLQILQIGIAANPNDPLAAAPAGRVAAPAAVAPAPVAEMPRVAREVPRNEVYDVPSPVAPTAPDERFTEERSYVATSVVGPLVGKVPLKNLTFFFRQAGTMLHAGVPIVQSLETLAGQARNAKLETILHEMAHHVKNGRPMSFGMQRYPEVFTPIVMSLVRAGEEGGFLDQSLSQVADYLDREIELRNLYRRVTFWPKLQVAMSIIIILGANAIISSINAKAQHLWSPLTQPETWLYLGPLIVAIFLFFRVGLANPRIKYNWDLMVAKIPYLGKIMRELSMARFGRSFGALYQGGIPVNKAFKMSADACGNEYLRAKMYPAYRELEEGRGIAETFRATHAFSPIVLDMVSTGETTGNLDAMLIKMSEFYEDETATKSTQLGYVVGALVTLLVCIYIGLIVINFWTSYYGGLGSAM